MIISPNLEQFMSWPLDPEDDCEPAPPVSPLESIAESLRTLAESLGSTGAAAAVNPLQELHDELERAYADLDAKYDVMLDLIEEVEGIVKPSTSKVSLEVKAAIARWKAPEVPADPSIPQGPQCGECERYFADRELLDRHDCAAAQQLRDGLQADLSGLQYDADARPIQPQHDAPVEEWRAYARAVHGAAEETVIDQMNRSQIRTLLGLPQTTEG